MKLLIASDLHGSAFFTEKLIEAFTREKADRLLLLGDILYHGPRNDLPKDYAPKKVVELLNRYKDKIFCVRGNCDADVDQKVLEFPIKAEYCVLTVGERLIYATHGHLCNMDRMPPLSEGDILLNGHTHIPACEAFGNNNIYMNCGSVSIPKGDSTNSYMTLENGEFRWKNIEGAEFNRYFIKSFV